MPSCALMEALFLWRCTETYRWRGNPPLSASALPVSTRKTPPLRGCGVYRGCATANPAAGLLHGSHRVIVRGWLCLLSDLIFWLWALDLSGSFLSWLCPSLSMGGTLSGRAVMNGASTLSPPLRVSIAAAIPGLQRPGGSRRRYRAVTCAQGTLPDYGRVSGAMPFRARAFRHCGGFLLINAG